MTIEKAILSAKEPKETNTAWVQPKGDSLQLNIFNNGKWRPIAGSGNSSSDSGGCGCNDFEIELTGSNPINIDGANINKGNFQDIYAKITNGQLINGKVFYKAEMSDRVIYFFNEIQFITAGIDPDTNKPTIAIKSEKMKILWTEDSVVVDKEPQLPG